MSRGELAPNLQEYVNRVVAQAPPLTDAQQQQVAALFRANKQALTRRRDAALRLPPLADGRRDPLQRSPGDAHA